MPRKSVAALAVADGSRHLVTRPAPPADLTDIQKSHWVEISNSLPADWWHEDNKQLLAEYCRTLSSLAFLNQQINELESASPEEFRWPAYLTLLKRRESHVRVMLSQATKMRLTQQSRYGERSAKTASDAPRAPGNTWEFG
jgi:hypothetical protein